MNHHAVVANELGTISHSVQIVSQSVAAIANQPAGLPQIQVQLAQLLAGQNGINNHLNGIDNRLNNIERGLYVLNWNAESDRLRQGVINEIIKLDIAARQVNSSPAPDDPLTPLALPLPPPPVAPAQHGPQPVAPPIVYPNPFPANRLSLDTWGHIALDTLLAGYGLPSVGNLSNKRATLLHYLIGQ